MKDTESRRVALPQVAEDLHTLLQQVANIKPIYEWTKYTQLQTSARSAERTTRGVH